MHNFELRPRPKPDQISKTFNEDLVPVSSSANKKIVVDDLNKAIDPQVAQSMKFSGLSQLLINPVLKSVTSQEVMLRTKSQQSGLHPITRAVPLDSVQSSVVEIKKEEHWRNSLRTDQPRPASRQKRDKKPEIKDYLTTGSLATGSQKTTVESK